MLFDDFYTAIWHKVSVIAIAIQMVNCGLSAGDSLPKEQMLDVPEKLKMLVSKQDALDVWNERLENLN
jgi:hypothetical protein